MVTYMLTKSICERSSYNIYTIYTIYWVISIHQFQTRRLFDTTRIVGIELHCGSYRTRKEVAIFEHAEEVRDEETPEHQTHGEKSRVGVRPLDLQLLYCDVAIGTDFSVHCDDRVERVVMGVVQVFVVQDQRVTFEDLRRRDRMGIVESVAQRCRMETGGVVISKHI